MSEEFDFELRRYLLQRNAVVITREQLHRLEGFENLAAARSDRDPLAAAVVRVRAALEGDVWSDRDPHGQLQKYLDALDGNPS